VLEADVLVARRSEVGVDNLRHAPELVT